MKKVSVIFLILILFILPNVQAQTPKFEFRAVWVATVNNIDWPSSPGLSTDQQKREVIDILNMHQSLGMNAIILQVRPTSDAFYVSLLEPWSRYLTGTPGKAPEPFYDPLQFWIEECHKRGMELHAWLNPFRVAQNANQPLAGNHIAFQHPEWFVQYGNLLYFDPGLPQSREFLNQVVIDIVSRYDIDAIHFDDYFYPYPLADDFPDSASFARYNRGFSPENKANWRRENVDIVIEMLSNTIKSTKPWVKFGISPFGVWRNISDDPRGSNTRAGTTNYDHLYADIRKWLENGWIDYCLPQIYWQIGHPQADFETLANWWKNNSFGRAMYVGHAVYKSETTSTVMEWRQPGELPRQIEMLRTIPEIDGSAFYSSNHFFRNLMGFQDSLRQNLYSSPALVPPMPWIDNIPPLPVSKIKKSGTKIKWKVKKTDNEMDKPYRYLIYLNERNSDTPPHFFIMNNFTECEFARANEKKKKYEVRVSVLDRLNNESALSKAVKIKL